MHLEHHCRDFMDWRVTGRHPSAIPRDHCRLLDAWSSIDLLDSVLAGIYHCIVNVYPEVQATLAREELPVYRRELETSIYGVVVVNTIHKRCRWGPVL